MYRYMLHIRALCRNHYKHMTKKNFYLLRVMCDADVYYMMWSGSYVYGTHIQNRVKNKLQCFNLIIGLSFEQY